MTLTSERVVACMICGDALPNPRDDRGRSYGVHVCRNGIPRIYTQADWEDAYPEEWWRQLFSAHRPPDTRIDLAPE